MTAGGYKRRFGHASDHDRFPQAAFTPSFVPMQVTKDLLLPILGRDLVTPEAVAQWVQLRFNAQEKVYE